MLTKQTSLPNSRVRLAITVPVTEFTAAFEQALTDLAPTVRIPGFRPGKAPRDQALKHLTRPRVEAEALDKAIAASYQEALKGTDLVPVAPAEIEIDSYTAPDERTAPDAAVLNYMATVDVLPSVSVKGYEKLKVKTVPAVPVSEKEVDEVIEQLRRQHADLQPAPSESEAKVGMWADIGYSGTVDGVARTDMANQHHPLILGEGQLIPGFEEAIQGMKAGEEKSFPVTFPKDYHAEALRGKQAEFAVTLHELRTVNLPEENDAFAKQYGKDSLAELIEAIRTDLKSEKETQQRRAQEETVAEALLKLIQFEVPASLVDREVDHQLVQAKERLQRAHLEWSRYLEQTHQDEAAIRAELRPQAEKSVRLGLILGKVMEAEGIESGDGAAQKVMDRLVAIATR